MPRINSPKVRQKFSWRTMLVGIAVLGAILAVQLYAHAAFERADLFTYDLRLNRMPAQPSSGAVVIAALDDTSIAQLGQWPWPRSVLARLEYALREYKVSVVGYDILFTESDQNDLTRAEIGKRLTANKLSQNSIREILGASNDEAFAEAMKSQGTTILGYPFESHNRRSAFTSQKVVGYLTKVRPPEPLTYGLVARAAGTPKDPALVEAQAYAPPIEVLNQAARSTAYVDLDHDADGEVRSILTVIRFDDAYRAPFVLAIARVFAGDGQLAMKFDKYGVAGVSVAGLKLPVDDHGGMLINFRHGAHPFPRYSISDIIDHKVPPQQLEGKIVLIGATAHGLGDRMVTPFGGDVPGVEVHAHALDNILQGDFIQRPEEAQEITWIAAVLMSLAIAIGVAWLSALSSAALVIILCAGYYTYAQIQLNSDHMVIGMVFPLLASLTIYMVLAGYRYVTEGLEKRHLRHAFEHYLHPDVIANVIEHPGGLKLGGERRHLTILFADIVNYTNLSERTDPAALVALLNDYMTKMTDHIMESGGVVDKIRGDGIMAFWGAPLDLPGHARAAIESGLKMLAELDAMRKRDPRFADIDIGVGIATGDAIVGNFGGERRFDYSVIGDTVNLASRLEGLTRQFKVHLLVSRQSYVEAGSGFVARELGLVKVKGKELAVPIVEVAGRENDSVDPGFYGSFSDALKLIRDGAAAAAREELRRLEAERPKDTPVQMYLERLQAAADNPPAEIVFEFESK